MTTSPTPGWNSADLDLLARASALAALPDLRENGVIVPILVRVVPARPEYEFAYLGNDQMLVVDGNGSTERFTGRDIADTIVANLRRDLDCLWAIGEVKADRLRLDMP